MQSQQHPATKYVWDYQLSEAQFESLLQGQQSIGTLDQKWAAVRLIEYASYYEIRERIGFRMLVANWPDWRDAVRSQQRRESLDFLVDWLPKNYPELLQQ